MSFKILSHVCYLNEAKSLLRLISRTAFIMTYDEPMFAVFKRRAIELPYSYLNQVSYVAPSIEKRLKISSKLKEIGRDMHDVWGMRTCGNILNLAQNTSSLKCLSSPMGCDSNLSDLDECHELI